MGRSAIRCRSRCKPSVAQSARHRENKPETLITGGPKMGCRASPRAGAGGHGGDFGGLYGAATPPHRKQQVWPDTDDGQWGGRVNSTVRLAVELVPVVLLGQGIRLPSEDDVGRDVEGVMEVLTQCALRAGIFQSLGLSKGATRVWAGTVGGEAISRACGAGR